MNQIYGHHIARPFPGWAAGFWGAVGALVAWHIAAVVGIVSSQDGRVVVWGCAILAALMMLAALTARHRPALNQLDAPTVQRRAYAVCGVAMLVGIVVIALAAHLFPAPVQRAMLWWVVGATP